MKASLKLTEDQKPPILRFKIPISILGFPFQSGVSACGDSKNLSLNLSTFFEFGPSIKLEYKPNDSWNPFSLVVKTGIGAFGSPISAPLSMSAEFNLLSRGNPTFLLRIKPQFGDFGFKKVAKSDNIVKFGEKVEGNGWLERVNGGGQNAVSNVVDGIFNGVEVSAKTSLPIRNKAVVKFNWGVRIPSDISIEKNPNLNLNPNPNPNPDPISVFSKIPFLVMNKISIEHVAGGDKKRDADVAAEVEEGCLGVKKQLEVLYMEHGLLRRTLEELRSEIGGRKSGLLEAGKYTHRKLPEFGGFAGKVVDGDVNEEVKNGSGV